MTQSDEDLTVRVRSGDHAAYGELYRRHHRAAQSTARCLLRSRADADDVVADAFAGVLAAIRNGRGPHDNFRRYLLACVRNGCRVRQRTVPVAPEDARFERPDGRRAVLEDPERFVEADVVARAFAALAPRWQEMLWATAVEQKSAQEAGEQMALSPNAAAALALRARQAFATAYLAEHVGHAATVDCERYAPHLAAYVRDQLPPARGASVHEHVVSCPACAHAVADLRDVNSALRSLLPAPAAALLGVGAATELAVTTGALAGTSAGLPFGGLLLKGLAGVLLLAPVLVSDVSPFDSDAADVRQPITEVDEAASGPVDVPVPVGTPVVLPPPAPVTTAVATELDASEPPRVDVAPVVGPIATTPATAPVVATVPVAAAPRITVPPVLDATIDTLGLAPLLGTLGATVDGVAALVTTATDTVVTEVVEPVLDRGVIPLVGAVTELVAGLVERVTDPLAPLVVVGEAPPATTLADADEPGAPATPLPTVTAPSLGAPLASTPPLTVGPVTVAPPVPAVTAPTLTVPVATTPPLTVPSITTPAVVVPIVTITVPALSLPAVALPGLTVTAPPLLGAG